MSKKTQTPGGQTEMKSVNENIYDMFSVAELEERLQMSALSWGCGTDECTEVTQCESLNNCENLDAPDCTNFTCTSNSRGPK